jgi:hypothetical protein
VSTLDLSLSLSLTLGLPLLLTMWLAIGRHQSRLQWLTILLLTVALDTVLHVAGVAWTMLGLAPRWALWIALAAAVQLGFRRARTLPWLPAKAVRPWLGWSAALLALLSLASSLPELLASDDHGGAGVQLAFPFAAGTFHIAHGGSTALMNAHHDVPAQRYALDIVAVGARGTRAHGLSPTQLDAYEVWGKLVLAPCAGEVLERRDELPDLQLGDTDTNNPAGNYVALHCSGVTVLLAHLKQGSVVVSRGAAVRRGEPLGRVGNSGNTSEPHLHLHAVRGRQTVWEALASTGRAVPMYFGGRFLLRNDRVRQGALR